MEFELEPMAFGVSGWSASDLGLFWHKMHT